MGREIEQQWCAACGKNTGGLIYPGCEIMPCKKCGFVCCEQCSRGRCAICSGKSYPTPKELLQRILQLGKRIQALELRTDDLPISQIEREMIYADMEEGAEQQATDDDDMWVISRVATAESGKYREYLVFYVAPYHKDAPRPPMDVRMWSRSKKAASPIHTSALANAVLTELLGLTAETRQEIDCQQYIYGFDRVEEDEK